MKLNTEIKAEVLRARTNCGLAEYEVCLTRAAEANGGEQPTSKQIIEALDAWRTQHGASVSPFGSSFATEEAWRKIAEDSEKAARELLLESSAELQSLTAIEKQLFDLQRQAKAQEDRLNAWFSEYSSLPAKAANANDRIWKATAEREALGEPLEAKFNEAYTKLVEGDLQYTNITAQYAATIATREFRLRILDAMKVDAENELAKLEVRNRELAKLLGRPKLDLRK
jgi:hypothetical protein